MTFLEITLASLGVISVVLFISIMYLWREVRAMKAAQALFLVGKEGKSLEETLLAHIKQITQMDEDIQELYTICEKIHKIASLGLHNVGVVRFNPFKDVGGDQSFAVALLDGKKNGVVFSSLFTKTGVRVYAKPIKEALGIEKYPLTEEEKEAVRIASPLKKVSEFRGE